MTITCHDGKSLGCEVKVYTVHHRTDFLICRSKKCSGDIVCQHGRTYLYCCCILFYCLYLWKFVCILSCEIIVAILVDYLHVVCCHIYFKSNRLLWQFFHRINYRTAADSKLSVSIRFIKLNLCLHLILLIRSGKSEDAIVYFKKDAFKDL